MLVTCHTDQEAQQRTQPNESQLAPTPKCSMRISEENKERSPHMGYCQQSEVMGKAILHTVAFLCGVPTGRTVYAGDHKDCNADHHVMVYSCVSFEALVAAAESVVRMMQGRAKLQSRS